MASAEEKIDLLVKEVKNLQLEQVKLITKVDAINTWSITAEKTTSDLRNTMKDLTSRMAPFEAATSAPPPQASSHEEEGRAVGHRYDKIHQGADPGSSMPDPTLVKSESHKPHYYQFETEIPKSSDRKFTFHASQPQSREYKLSRIDFPIFDEEHPKVWRDKCEKYFIMFNVPVHVWVPFDTINFRGNAELWLQTYEAQHCIDSWPELCVAIEQKFSRNLYHNYMRDLLTIRQASDELEYATRFEQEKHRILVHNKDMGEVFFVQKFLDWLKYNISNAITLHKSRTVDAALSLALMQEEILEAQGKRYPTRSSDSTRFQNR